VSLSDSAGKKLRRTQTDATGAYRFENVPAGDYIVAPSFPGLFFSPAARSLNVHSNIRRIDFFAFVLSFASAVPVPPAPIAEPVATPAPGATAPIPIDDGAIAIPLPPAAPTPASTASPTTAPTTPPTTSPAGGATLSGRVTTSSGVGLRGITVVLSDGAGHPLRRVQTDLFGAFLLADVPDGDYIITPQFPGLAFAPSSRAGQVRGADVAGNTFIASLAGR
jgi:hypothetical protein